MRVDEVEIENPCDEDLDRMELDPTGVERHCARCCKSVHDLSALGPERARTLLAGREPICISYWSNDLGEVLFERRHATAPRSKSDFVPLTRLARAASLIATLSACTPHGDPLDEHHDPAPTQALREESVVQPVAEPPPEPSPEEPCEPELQLELELEPELPPARDPKFHAIKGKRKTAGVRRPVNANSLDDL